MSGHMVAIGYLDGQVRLWNYETEKLLAEFTDQHQRIWAVAFSPDDSWLVAGGNEGVPFFYEVRIAARASSFDWGFDMGHGAVLHAGRQDCRFGGGRRDD